MSELEESIDVEAGVRDFYDNYGWLEGAGEPSGEDTLFRDFSPAYYPYHDDVNARTAACFDGRDGKLLMAGGGDLPETHVAIAERFDEPTFLDISEKALEIARQKVGRGEYVCGSILDIPKDDLFFDAVYCAHVIYHIDENLQSQAIRELIRVTRPGGRIVVLYRNPHSLPARILRKRLVTPSLRKLRKLIGRPTKREAAAPDRPRLYFSAHPLEWWKQFEDECSLNLIPWDVMSNQQEELIFMNNWFATVGYRVCSWFENAFPAKAVQWWSYPVIELTKKQRVGSTSPPV